MNDTSLLEKKYPCLPLDTFAQTFQSPTQSYKFFWFEAVLRLSLKKDTFSFDEVVDEIIYIAWPLVVRFHLRLGPAGAKDKPNFIAAIIEKLAESCPEALTLSREQIARLIREKNPEIRTLKKELCRYVPYRILAPFLSEYGVNEKIWSSISKTIELIHSVSRKIRLPYVIEAEAKGRYEIRVDQEWRNLFIQEYPILLGWLQFEKSLYLQNKNPNVPGIVIKVSWENQKARKLQNVRKLWDAIAQLYPDEFISIYTGKVLDRSSFEIDHFIPWSFVSSDELWNLVPVEKDVNIRKSNRLPDWEEYFDGLVKMKNLLKKSIHSSRWIHQLFDRCRQDNLNETWARESLYQKEDSERDISRILASNVHPIYDLARMQGFREWRN